MQFVVLSSSRGTTFQSVIDRMNDGSLTATCLGLVTDRADRGCIEKAKAAGLPYRVVEREQNADRSSYERDLNEAILNLITSNQLTSKRVNESPITSITTPQSNKPLLALMGWMWIFSPAFISKWKGKIVNVHPALLPKYGGEGMYGYRVHKAVLDSGDAESGMTIHSVNSGVDTGGTLLQKTCPVLTEDNTEDLCQRVQKLEKEWYPKLLQMIEEGEVLL